MRDLLAALFYPALVTPQIEKEIHDGRKRIDLVFDKVASQGFFAWLTRNYRAPHILMECKNYVGDPANEALDQLSGRFSPRRGKVGFHVCRDFEDKDLFLRRCRDTADDDRGYVLVLDDLDLAVMVAAATESDGVATVTYLEFPVLRERFQALVM